MFFENVDGRQTDARCLYILSAHMLAFGSREIKKSCIMRKPLFWVTEQTGLYSHRSWLEGKICDLERRGVYYPCNKNKGAYQLHGYHIADLRLCFQKCKKKVFS